MRPLIVSSDASTLQSQNIALKRPRSGRVASFAGASAWPYHNQLSVNFPIFKQVEV